MSEITDPAEYEGDPDTLPDEIERTWARDDFEIAFMSKQEAFQAGLAVGERALERKQPAPEDGLKPSSLGHVAGGPEPATADSNESEESDDEEVTSEPDASIRSRRPVA